MAWSKLGQAVVEGVVRAVVEGVGRAMEEEVTVVIVIDEVEALTGAVREGWTSTV